MSDLKLFPCADIETHKITMKTVKNIKKRKFKRTIPDNLKI